MTDRTTDRRCRLVQRGGRLQGRDRAPCHKRFEPGDIDVEASLVERHDMVVADQDRVGPEHAAQRHEGLAQALACVLVACAWPQQRRERGRHLAVHGLGRDP